MTNSASCPRGPLGLGPTTFAPRGRILSHTSPPIRALYPDSLCRPVASVTSTVPVTDMYVGDDHSWQDVYASYGCSLDFDVSDDDG